MGWRCGFLGRDGGRGGRYAGRWCAEGVMGCADAAVFGVFTRVKICGIKNQGK